MMPKSAPTTSGCQIYNYKYRHQQQQQRYHPCWCHFPFVLVVGILVLSKTIAAFTIVTPLIRTTTLWRPLPRIQPPQYRSILHQIIGPTTVGLSSSSSLAATNPKATSSSTTTNNSLSMKSTTLSSSSSSSSSALSFIDIGANLLDERFLQGIYNGKQRHEPDWDAIIQRAQQVGVKAIILTAGTLDDSRQALELVRSLRLQQQQHQQLESNTNNNDENDGVANRPIRFGCTIGIHPTRCQQEFLENGNYTPEEVLRQLRDLALDGQRDQSVVALGEMGLDYDRLEFCNRSTQLEYFQQQLQIFSSQEELHQLPLFLHNRNVGTDLLQVLKEEQQQQQQSPTSRRHCHGVVHSFDDSLELALQFIELGFYIGINGCSLKTEENLKVVEQLPLDKILLETDCPYCEIKNTHAGSKYIQTTWEKKMDKKFEWGKMVKGRNEPCQIIQVAEVIAAVKKLSLEEVAQTCFQNSLQLYGWNKEEFF